MKQLSPRDELETFTELIEILKKADCPIIVEGKRDIAALKKFNINNVHQLTSSVESSAERVAGLGKEVIILTDLDREGRSLYIKLLRVFSRLGVRVNNKPRELLMKTRLTQVEGLFRRFMRLQNQ